MHDVVCPVTDVVVSAWVHSAPFSAPLAMFPGALVDGPIGVDGYALSMAHAVEGPVPLVYRVILQMSWGFCLTRDIVLDVFVREWF